MFLFTCQLRLKNVVTELSFSDIFLTASHFAEKLPPVPMLELCCKQWGEPLCFTAWTVSVHEHHMCFHWLWNSLLIVWGHMFYQVWWDWGFWGLEKVSLSPGWSHAGLFQGSPALRATQRWTGEDLFSIRKLWWLVVAPFWPTLWAYLSCVCTRSTL